MNHSVLRSPEAGSGPGPPRTGTETQFLVLPISGKALVAVDAKPSLFSCRDGLLGLRPAAVQGGPGCWAETRSGRPRRPMPAYLGSLSVVTRRGSRGQREGLGLGQSTQSRATGRCLHEPSCVFNPCRAGPGSPCTLHHHVPMPPSQGS